MGSAPPGSALRRTRRMQAALRAREAAGRGGRVTLEDGLYAHVALATAPVGSALAEVRTELADSDPIGDPTALGDPTEAGESIVGRR